MKRFKVILGLGIVSILGSFIFPGLLLGVPRSGIAGLELMESCVILEIILVILAHTTLEVERESGSLMVLDLFDKIFFVVYFFTVILVILSLSEIPCELWKKVITGICILTYPVQAWIESGIGYVKRMRD